MPVKKKKKKITKKKLQRGTVGNFFVFGILALLIVIAISAIGGLPSTTAPLSGQVVKIITPTQSATYSNLQLKWFGYVTIPPTNQPPPGLCNNKTINNEQYILVGYSPPPGQTTSQNGSIKVWANDEHAPMIAPGEQVDPNTGQVTAYGNTSLKAPDGYLYEPALYIAPNTAETGGQAYFPDFINGQYNNNGNQNNRNTWNTVVSTKKRFSNGLLYETPPPGSGIIGGKNPNGPAPNQYVAEYTWNVSKLGLTNGTYMAEFVVHDGDEDRAIGCVNISIQ